MFQIEKGKKILINETGDRNELEISLEDDSINLAISDNELGTNCELTHKQAKNLCFLIKCMLKNKENEELRKKIIQDIDNHYPIDSDFDSTNNIGKELLIEAILDSGNWRDFPIEILERWRDLCFERSGN